MANNRNASVAHLSCFFCFLDSRFDLRMFCIFVFFCPRCCHVCLLVCHLFFWRDSFLEVGNLTNLRGRGSWESLFNHRGKFEGSDPQGENLRKFLYQAYHMLKKVKSAQMLTWRIFISVVFSRHKKNKTGVSRQTRQQLVLWDSLVKTVKVKTGTELFWQEEKRTKNCWNLF